MQTERNESPSVVTRYIEDELKDSYLTYAMSVNTNRAIPDVRDGLKPSTRRILYAMGEINLTSNRPYDKCAAVIGEVMKNFHPHGNGPIYDTLVGLTQEFTIRYPLVDGQGNFGSIDSDPPGAMRYTECRLAAIADSMLVDIHKNTVDFQPNYKESTNEPIVLPALLPNLLVNGTTGIGVGYLTRIPPHNLGEVVDALVAMLDNPQVTLSELMQHMPGPDFPTAGIIVSRSGIRDMYATGKGSITVRARAIIEETTGGKEHIIVTEIPYQVKKDQLLSKMYDLVTDKTITGISDIRDESDREIRVIIELKRGVIAQVVLNQLYKHTQMQTNYGAIMLCLVNGLPQILPLKSILVHYLTHRREVIRRRTQFDLDRSEARAHVLEGYRIALNNLEEVIEIVQNAESPQEAQESLMANYELSELQAGEILTMTLRQLTGLERQKINDEYANVLERIEELRAILASEALVTDIMKNELLELKEEYGDERRTEIIDEMGSFEIEDLIADEEMVVTISHAGYIKRIPMSTYRRQNRGGVGVMGMGTKEGDFVEHTFVASAHQYILFFSNRGKCYWLKVFQIPEGGRTAAGRAVVNLLRLQEGEKTTAFVTVRQFDENRCLFMTTRRGIVKKSRLSDFRNPNSGGIIAINLDEEDQLIGVQLAEENDHIILVTRQGMSVHFSETEVRCVGRTARGVRGIRLSDDDVVVGMVVSPDENTSLLVVTANGYGKRTAVKAYRYQSRGGKGVIAIKTSTRNGLVVGAKPVSDGDELIIISSKGMVTRMAVSDIRVIGRNTQGVRLMSLRDDETVVDVGKISETSVPENGDNGERSETESTSSQ
ncbi:MAG: DNA gyrase subunit A [Candidatus Poribacteria bacterium]|nr:DNA gyrase subunit A [Candidatus Poribacteria bacterium]MDE0505814.1 DNA gyrase subunit A [Candidatus Poribacteria bacterium]